MKENKHSVTKRKLKITGWILIGLGAILTVTGFANFFISIGKGSMPSLFWCCFLGIPTLAIGGAVTGFAYKKEVMTYVKNETVPVINDISEDLKPGIKNVASAIKEGAFKDEDKIVCECGEENSYDSKYCKRCGKPLIVYCKNCGARVDTDSKFCKSCGKKL